VRNSVAHAVREKDRDRAAAAIGYIDGRSGVDGDVSGTQIATIILEGEARLAAGRKFVDETGGGIGDVDDGLTVAGDGDGFVELAGAVAMGTPGVDIFKGRSRRRGCGGGLRGAGAAGHKP
jgi:hypothetical protein